MDQSTCDASAIESCIIQRRFMMWERLSALSNVIFYTRIYDMKDRYIPHTVAVERSIDFLIWKGNISSTRSCYNSTILWYKDIDSFFSPFFPFFIFDNINDNMMCEHSFRIKIQFSTMSVVITVCREIMSLALGYEYFLNPPHPFNSRVDGLKIIAFET